MDSAEVYARFGKQLIDEFVNGKPPKTEERIFKMSVRDSVAQCAALSRVNNTIAGNVIFVENAKWNHLDDLCAYHDGVHPLERDKVKRYFHEMDRDEFDKLFRLEK